jgi:hypothetical protein
LRGTVEGWVCATQRIFEHFTPTSSPKAGQLVVRQRESARQEAIVQATRKTIADLAAETPRLT